MDSKHFFAFFLPQNCTFPSFLSVLALGDIQAPYMDILQPYTDGHGPRHSHRHVRDCQPSIHGNRTHESFRASNYSGLPVAESKLIMYNLPNRVVTGK